MNDKFSKIECMFDNSQFCLQWRCEKYQLLRLIFKFFFSSFLKPAIYIANVLSWQSLTENRNLVHSTITLISNIYVPTGFRLINFFKNGLFRLSGTNWILCRIIWNILWLLEVPSYDAPFSGPNGTLKFRH